METATKTDLSWMAEFCDKESHFEMLAAPLRLERDGKVFAWASDGRTAVMLESESDFKVPSAITAKKIFGLIDREFKLVAQSTFDKVKEWSGEQYKPTIVECHHCIGDGEHECHCGYEHECGFCGGEGTVEELPERRHGFVEKVPFDRDLTAKIVQRFSGPCDVLLHAGNKGGTSMLMLRGAGWIALQAALDGSQADKPGPTFP